MALYSWFPSFRSTQNSSTPDHPFDMSCDTPDDDFTETGVGLSDASLSGGRRRMLDVVNILHTMGVQVDIDLPQIAVIGSQSVGKSSLIESISGITLPRASGTCTRCPIECRLSHSTVPWKCVVKLRRTFPDGQIYSETFGEPIEEHRKFEVEDRIQRAQLAILNPSKDPSSQLSAVRRYFGPAELSFSQDCVSLEISGPDVADLSFCDLPGLIATTGAGGDRNDIELIRSLVVSYISKPSCIILLTVTCETDFQNQGAQELAKEYDPDGKRTIGVLTKPDRIPDGEEAIWFPLIRNEKESLENNWYCVKQPGPNELKERITWAQARESEDKFFTKQPWNELEVYQKYLRTGNLVKRLSSILSDLISKRLPEIHEELENSVAAARSSLEQLPKEPSKDPQNEISSLLHGFVTDLVRHIEGVPHENGLLQSIDPAQAKFKLAIRATAPLFLPFEKRFAGRKKLRKPEFLKNEEGEDEYEYEEDEDEDEDESEGESEGERRGRASGEGEHGAESGHDSVTPHSAEQAPKNKVIYIDQVFERARRARTRELPGSIPFVVKATLIEDIVKQWRAPMVEFCTKVYRALVDHVRKLVTEHFASFGHGGLEHHVKILMQNHIKSCMDITVDRVKLIPDIEEKPFSLNTDYDNYRAKFFAYYKGAREEHRNVKLMSAIRAYSATIPSGSSGPYSQPTGIAKVLEGLVEVGMPNVESEDLAKLFPPDKMEPALEIMADVRAYFQVAYKRFTDNVPMAIDHELVYGITRDVLPMLNTGLEIYGPEGPQICGEFAQENPRHVNQRQELRRKIERLVDANKQLLKVGL